MDKLPFLTQNGRRLRCGYTTGTCAAAAAQAAATLLLTGRAPESVPVDTPRGLRLAIPICRALRQGESALCAVRKDGGDDPDITDGMLVWARLTRRQDGSILIDGGEGVGRVTRPGLSVPVGQAAINPTPRRMIERAVRRALDEAQCSQGASVVISIPGGRQLAQKTFNPRLGIQGGLSILGTSGLVEPMSRQAMLDSLQLEMRQKRALGQRRLLLAPGNYGSDFLQRTAAVSPQQIVKCGNYLGAAIDMAVCEGYGEILLVSHLGKIVKVAGGILNTHSDQADARAELMAAAALRAGGTGETGRRILSCPTTEQMLAVLDEAHLLPETLSQLGEQIQFHLTRRASQACAIGAVVFSLERGLLCATGPAPGWLKEYEHKKEWS